MTCIDLFLKHNVSQPARPMRFRGPLFMCLSFCAALSGLVPAQAQSNWPDKPIRFIVPYTPGGGTDTVTRHLAEKITQDTQWAF
ncbi:MAG: hypothetical protein ACKOEU_07395, partial [Limnohabitans sp.]